MRKLVFIVIIGLVIVLYAGIISPLLVDRGILGDLEAPVGCQGKCAEEFQFRNYSETSVCGNLGGLVNLAFHMATPWLSTWRTQWGTTDKDLERYYPGDELVENPKWSYTHSITINAPQVAVWPWIVQIGQGKGGFYSYQGLENLMGCEIENAGKPINKFQHLRPGDEIYLHPDMAPLNVSSMRKYYWYVLKGTIETDEGSTGVSWTFYLKKIDNTTTRLITRGRYDYDDRITSELFFGTLLVEPINFVMGRKMLQGIKQRSESLWKFRYGKKL